MRDGAYDEACTGRDDWGPGNRYRCNRLEEGSLYTTPQPTSTRVGEESETRRRPRIFVFSPYIDSLGHTSVVKYKDSFASQDYYQANPESAKFRNAIQGGRLIRLNAQRR